MARCWWNAIKTPVASRRKTHDAARAKGVFLTLTSQFFQNEFRGAALALLHSLSDCSSLLKSGR